MQIIFQGGDCDEFRERMEWKIFRIGRATERFHACLFSDMRHIVRIVFEKSQGVDMPLNNDMAARVSLGLSLTLIICVVH